MLSSSPRSRPSMISLLPEPLQRIWRRYFGFRGRLSRRDFLISQLIWVLVLIGSVMAIPVFERTGFTAGMSLLGLLVPAFFWSQLALFVKRWRDLPSGAESALVSLIGWLTGFSLILFLLSAFFQRGETIPTRERTSRASRAEREAAPPPAAAGNATIRGGRRPTRRDRTIRVGFGRD